MIRLVDIIINNKLRFGYDIGKGFVVGVEEMLQQYERLSSILPHKSITRELRKRAEDSRLDVIRSLGVWKFYSLFILGVCVWVGGSLLA